MAVKPTEESAEKTPEQLKLELAEIKLKVAELEAANRDLAEGAGSIQGKFAREVRTTGPGKKKWPFEVTCPSNKEVKPAKIDAVDESEAIRLFVITALGEGKAIDTVTNRCFAVCKAPRERKEFNMNIRAARNLERGHVPTDAKMQGVGGVI